jgi:MFS family permease
VVSLLRERDFRLLVAGEGISLVGDQFYFIALPWLVLQLTASVTLLGLVLALQGISRAAFMLVGGAATDRLSPRRVMMGSNLARLGLVTLLAVMVLNGRAGMVPVAAVALAFGVADGFFFPAQSAIVPQLASDVQLTAANATVQGLDQVAQFVGPVLAGALIAAFVGGRGGLQGVGLALLVDAATFVISLTLLALMQVDRSAAARRRRAQARAEGGSLWTSIRAGLAYMWADRLLRMLLLLVLAVNFLAVGPLLVGVPALAKLRLAGDAQAFGAIMSAFGGGSLAGLAAAGALRRPPARLLGHVLLAVCAVFVLGLVALGLAHSLLAALVPAACMGFAAGYLTVAFFTWIQARTPQHLMGRMMSLIIFASVGLVPVSQAVSGVVASWSLTGLFVGAAVLLGLVVVRAWFVPTLRAMGLELAATPAGSRDSSVMPDGHQYHAEEHERRTQPLRQLKGLIEDEVGGKDLGRHESQADTDHVGPGERPVPHDAGECELHPQAKEATHDLPEDEGSQPIGMPRGGKAGRGTHVEELVEHDDAKQKGNLQADEGGDHAFETIGQAEAAKHGHPPMKAAREQILRGSNSGEPL